MPGGDRTGPMGMGPMTGRAAGYCAGYPVPGFMNAVGGRGFGGWGGRGGRGRRNWFYATGLTGWQRAVGGWPAFGIGQPYYGAPYAGAAVPPAMTEEQELDLLKRQAESLESALDAVKKRLAEFQT